MSEWQPIETAPKDGTEILGYRADNGVMLIRYTCPDEFLNESELQKLDADSAEQYDWFAADFVCGYRIGENETPTHWMIPEPPK